MTWHRCQQGVPNLYMQIVRSMAYLLMVDVHRQCLLGLQMIKGFKCKKTERLFNGGQVRKFSGFTRQAEKRLRILDAAETLEALRALPSNRFELLSGDRAGQYSVRVNMQWRVCFIWDDGAIEVEIVDYH